MYDEDYSRPIIMALLKGEGKRLHGNLICTYTLSEHISHFCRRFMHYKRETEFWKVVHCYLFTVSWRTMTK